MNPLPSTAAGRMQMFQDLTDTNVYDDDGNVIGQQETLISTEQARKLFEMACGVEIEPDRNEIREIARRFVENNKALIYGPLEPLRLLKERIEDRADHDGDQPGCPEQPPAERLKVGDTRLNSV